MSASRLNGYLVALKALRLSAVDELPDPEYVALVSIQCDEWGCEAARIHLADWLRALDAKDEDRAA